MLPEERLSTAASRARWTCARSTGIRAVRSQVLFRRFRAGAPFARLEMLTAERPQSVIARERY